MQNEYEMSVYNLDKADVAGQRQRWAQARVRAAVKEPRSTAELGRLCPACHLRWCCCHVHAALFSKPIEHQAMGPLFIGWPPSSLLFSPSMTSLQQLPLLQLQRLAACKSSAGQSLALTTCNLERNLLNFCAAA